MADSCLVELTDGTVTTQAWVVDEIGPWNTWNQSGASGSRLGSGHGDSHLAGGLGWTKLYDGGTILIEMEYLPYPGSCRVGQSGQGLSGNSTPFRGNPVQWSVLRVT